MAFTGLAARVDPEALHGVWEQFFDRAPTIVEAHGGLVDKFIGDEVMAVFRRTVVHEDDALRAVRAAVAMRDSVEEVERRWLGADAHPPGTDRGQHGRGRGPAILPPATTS